MFVLALDVIGKITAVSDVVPVYSYHQERPSDTRTVVLTDLRLVSACVVAAMFLFVCVLAAMFLFVMLQLRLLLLIAGGLRLGLFFGVVVQMNFLLPMYLPRVKKLLSLRSLWARCLRC